MRKLVQIQLFKGLTHHCAMQSVFENHASHLVCAIIDNM